MTSGGEARFHVTLTYFYIYFRRKTRRKEYSDVHWKSVEGMVVVRAAPVLSRG